MVNVADPASGSNLLLVQDRIGPLLNLVRGEGNLSELLGNSMMTDTPREYFIGLHENRSP
jgi:hypothetical protein